MINLTPKIKGYIDADEIHMGKGVVVEEGAGITANKVTLGDFCYIGKDVRIIVPEFSIGDYSKLHAGSFVHGTKPTQIGRNCWIGGSTILDSNGGLVIDDGVGIGAQSQIWTHIKFGDIVEGCNKKWYSEKYMHIKKDVWFVGHCIVSPIEVGEKSMALAGSVVTKDMVPNHIYAGVPAQDVTHKLGTQFTSRTVEEKAAILQGLLDDFFKKYPDYKDQIEVVKHPDERKDGTSWFDVSTRTYNKIYNPAEIDFLKTYVPIVKFTPDGANPFIKL